MPLIKLNYSLVLFTFFFLLFALLVTPPSILASNILLQEDFNDNNVHDGQPTNWDEMSGGGNWAVINGQYIGTVNPNTSPPIALTGDPNWNDYSVDVDVTSIQGVDRHILFRFTQYHVSGYSVKFRNEDLGQSGLIELQKHGQNVVLQTNTSFKTHIGETHHFRITALANHIQVFGDNNPVALIDYTDNNQPILTGRVGFEIEPAGILSTTQTAYDNLVVSDFSSPNTILNIPDIKQYSAPWGIMEYDNASSWKPVPVNKTFDRWACALTSATMVLQYNGHNINPDALNTYLKNNNGYTRDGGVIWTAISKYTKDHDTQNSPSLEFAYHNINDTNIINELETNQRPAIFKLEKATNSASHFIVAKGKKEKQNPSDPQDYFVNDPYSSTNSTLIESKNDFGMSLVKYGIFAPSHTDLSYIVLFVDPNVSLKVFDTNGNEITDGYLKEGPVIDGVNKTSLSGSGVGLNAFYYPKPVDGIYKVEVSGNGTYQLDSYIYDINGNVNVKHFPQTVTTGQKDIFLVTSNNQTSINSNVQEVSFEALLNSLDTAYKNKLIKDKLGYLAVRTLIDAGRIEYNKGKTQLAKTSLNLAKSLLNAAKSSQIDLATRDQLVIQINTLISIL